MPQVITISPEGTISGLQVKPGKGLDLTKLGEAQVQRASEIVWDGPTQAWKVDVLQEAGKGVLRFRAFKAAAQMGFNAEAILALKKLAPTGFGITDDGATGDGDLTFASYDEAVRVEIAFLDALRVKGKF